MEYRKIQKFTDLKVWQESHKLILFVYSTVKTFPKEEMFDLSDQMRRCSVSVTSNIAEGFSRQSSKEKIHFYYTAKGSLTELENQILIARDVGYLTEKATLKLLGMTEESGKLLTGIIRSTKKFL